MPEGQDNHPPPPLSEAYRKTRRWYTFLSALLLTYALIGFEPVEIPSDPPPKKEGDQSIVIPINALGNVGIKFQNPNALPWVLGLLVIFFSYRTYIEWLMCSVVSPQDPAKVDHHVSQALGVLALTVSIIQLLLDIRIAEYLPHPNLQGGKAVFWMIFNGFGSGLFFYHLWFYWYGNIPHHLSLFPKWIRWAGGFGCLSVSFWLSFNVGWDYFWFILPMLSCGLGFGLVPCLDWLINASVKPRYTPIPKPPRK